MRRSVWFFVIVVLVVATSCVAGESGTVVKVVDGATLQVSSTAGTLTVRLIGIDTPELGRKNRTAEFLAEAARKEKWFYRIANEPPGLPIRRPSWSGRPALFQTLARIKQAYDPGGCLRPGAYSVDSLRQAAEFFANLEERVS